MEPHSITLIDITKSFNHNLNVLNNVSAHFKQGDTYAITGDSGSGKSTLLSIIGLIEKPSSGTILIDNHSVACHTEHEKSLFLNSIIGLVFQQPHFIEELSVLQNVILPGLIKKIPLAACVQKGEKLLEAVGLEQKKEAFPKSLSGGQQQRLVLARALFCEPAFLLADEPTGNLDPHTAQLIIDLLLECQAKWNMGLIMSTHDQRLASRMGTIFEIRDGSVTIKNNTSKN
jgi:lipoprotein-releasing system ATP-binding protein